MQTIGDLSTNYKQTLTGLYGTNEAEALALMVISEVCELSKAKIKAFPELEIPVAQSEKLKGILDELKTGKPVQYILGKTEFYGLTFKVTPAVLIPRPETEELVEWAIQSIEQCKLRDGSILDIGTGSGCIAISLKKNLPGSIVSAIDISTDALSVAKENAKINDVEINFKEVNILETKKPLTVSQSPFTNHYSLIISNPPYVTGVDKTQMHSNVTDFEPHTALFVPDDNPLLFYDAIADFALQRLSPNGLLFFEINESYGEEMVKLLSDKGFKNIILRQDMPGRDRMIRASVN